MLTSLQHFVTLPKKEILLFDETQSTLFLDHAIPLLQSGYSIGPISTEIIKALNICVNKTVIKGVYTCAYNVTKPSILCFSSGTKNHQKGIVRSFKSWQTSFGLIANEIANFPNMKAVVFGALPFSLSLFGAMESLQRNQRPLVFPTQEMRHFKTLAPTSNYILWITPFHADFLISMLKDDQLHSLTNIRYIFVGGASFSTHQRKALQNVFPKAQIFSFYGTSEASFICIKRPTDNSNSEGEICKDVQLKILDKNQLEAPRKTPGDIWVKSNQLFDGYLQKKETLNFKNEFLSIGDKGYIDDQNRLCFVGRAGRQISISGHVVDLEQLESWYKNTLATEALVLFSKTNERKENKLVLVTSKNLTPACWESIKKQAYAALGAQGVPNKWVHCPEWPLLANGKVALQKLKTWV